MYLRWIAYVPVTSASVAEETVSAPSRADDAGRVRVSAVNAVPDGDARHLDIMADSVDHSAQPWSRGQPLR